MNSTGQLRDGRKRLHRWCFSAIVLFAGLSGNAQSSAGASSQQATEEIPTIAVTSTLVVLPVNVIDPGGSFVPGLSKEDFRVYDGKQLQNLVLFQQEDTPVTVGLIVDRSASMQSKLPEVLASISTFIQSRNDKDEMFVVNFNDKVVLEPLGGKAFSSDPEELSDAVRAVSASGRTALYDALAVGLNHSQLSQKQKKALIVISDGGDNASNFTHSDILALARESQVSIYSIVLVDPSAKDQNPKALLQLCKETGGIGFSPSSRETTMRFSERIAADLREQYTLGFAPGDHFGSGSFHKLQVRVSTHGQGALRVRTRSGYSLPSETTRLDIANR